VKCEICKEFPATYQCELCGKKMCHFCSRFLERPVKSIRRGEVSYFKIDLTICKLCAEKLRLSIRIASIKENKE